MAGKELKSVPEPWREYRKRHILAVAGLLLGLPLLAVVGGAGVLWLGSYGIYVLIALLSLWGVFWGWAALHVVRWPCPRCGKAWLSHQEPVIGSPFSMSDRVGSRSCSNCGLALYERP